jgi:hypothetical protein
LNARLTTLSSRGRRSQQLKADSASLDAQIEVNCACQIKQPKKTSLN